MEGNQGACACARRSANKIPDLVSAVFRAENFF